MFRDTVVCLCDSSRNGCNRVAIATNRDSKSYRALKVVGFQERFNCLWYTALAGCIETVLRAYLINREVQVVKAIFDQLSNFLFRHFLQCSPGCNCGSLSAF